WGNISLLAAAVTWALYSVLIRKVTRELDTLPVSFVALCGGLLVTVPAGAWELSRQDIGEITGWMVAGMLYLGIISMAIASFLWNKSFELLEAGTASLTLFAQPLVGAFLGTLYLGEQVSPLFVVGGGLIALGLGLAAGEKT
ncbi:MAG: DMT family transporter, partial [Anaerolineae bacterium]|nr:DMT family transporter [Anaerolineae bacterium]